MPRKHPDGASAPDDNEPTSDETTNASEKLQTVCKFRLAWIGACGRTDCGEPATHDCPQTIGPLCCGAPLCDAHEHDDPSKLCPTVESLAYVAKIGGGS